MAKTDRVRTYLFFNQGHAFRKISFTFIFETGSRINVQDKTTKKDFPAEGVFSTPFHIYYEQRQPNEWLNSNLLYALAYYLGHFLVIISFII
jgi:hypothetical protein